MKLVTANTRREWRAWLKKNHAKEKEAWLVYYRKSSGKRRIPYNDAVEEALSFGWIDSTVRNVDRDRYAQRFTPRRSGSPLSEMNKERARKLIKAGKMTKTGLASAKKSLGERLVIPAYILKALKNDKVTWENFRRFPESYKRIRIGWIANARSSDRKRRLLYFLKMTKMNKKFGMVQ